jgi:hypothetical protein
VYLRSLRINSISGWGRSTVKTVLGPAQDTVEMEVDHFAGRKQMKTTKPGLSVPGIKAVLFIPCDNVDPDPTVETILKMGIET